MAGNTYGFYYREATNGIWRNPCARDARSRQEVVTLR